MFETGMSALVLKICSEYAKALGLNFPPCVQQEINAITQWVSLHTVKDLNITQDGNIVTFKFTEDKEEPTVFTIELPEEYVLSVNDLYNLIKGSSSVVVDKSADGTTLEVRLDKSQEVQYVTLSPDSATQGTLTVEQFTTLQLNKGNCIILNNEIYRLSDNQHTAGVISYVHTGWDSNIINKSINITISTRAWTMVKAESKENFVKAFTIPNGVSTGTLTADVKQKLCNPDGHNYYVFDSTSEMILTYSFNSEDEIIQYKAVYFVNDKAYDITMQIFPSNGSWRRSQTVINGATANPTLTGTESNLTGLKVGGTIYKIPESGGGGKLYKHNCNIKISDVSFNLVFFDYQSTPHTIATASTSPKIGYKLTTSKGSYPDITYYFGIIDSYAENGYVSWYFIPYGGIDGKTIDTFAPTLAFYGQQITSLTDTVTEL